MKLRFLFCAVVFFSISAAGQEAPPKPQRPKIGLALEGGGALGFAHIAVLKWFEEHNIPVDYVAGTSMGALVGGMYAMGTSPEDIEKAVKQLEPDRILYGDVDYGSHSFRFKEEQHAYLNSLQISLRSGFQLPSGLNTGQKINFVLEKAALPYSYLHSFDELPIPFRCVATNLTTGSAKIFDRGSLSEAMRSSMSIPGVFTPVVTAEGVFVDGGLLNNLPTDVLKQMGAQIIIAVHLRKRHLAPSDIKSVLDVLQGSLDAMVRHNEEHGRDLADLVIDVDVAEFKATDFGELEKIERQGQAAAENGRAALLSFQLPPAEWGAYVNARSARILKAIPKPQAIEVEGEVTQAPKLANEIRDHLARFTKRELDPDELKNALTALNGDSRFTRIEYRMHRAGDSDNLLVYTQDRGYRAKRVRVGFELNAFEPNDVQYSLGVGATFLDLGGLNSDLRVDVAAGSTYRLRSEYFRPFTPAGHWFFAPRADISTVPVNLYARDTFVADYRFYHLSGALDFGYRFGNWGEVRVGYEAGRLRDALRVGASALPQVRGRTGASSIKLRVDHVDDPVVPRQGVTGEVAFRWLDASPGAGRAFPLAEANLGVYQRVSGKGSVFFTASGGTTFGYAATGLPQFFLGAPERLAAYGANELRTNQYFLFRAGYEHRLFELPPLFGKGVFATSTYEIGKVYGVPSASRLPNDFAAGLVMETVLGPAFIGASVGDTGHHKWFFQLGHVF